MDLFFELFDAGSFALLALAIRMGNGVLITGFDD